jgi:DNA-binding HxlR family transcriptional regulator
MRKVQENPRNCPVTRTVGYIGNKWKPIILLLLSDGQVRFGKLNMFLPTISRKILTQQLRELEQDGLINRHSYMEKPPRVEYSMSEMGKTLIPIIEAMNKWGVDIGTDSPRSAKLAESKE